MDLAALVIWFMLGRPLGVGGVLTAMKTKSWPFSASA